MIDRSAALAWIAGHGRDLERALVGHVWRNGSVDAVIAALEAYRCADGGYGRGLEPDAAQVGSSVLDTCAALAVHQCIGTPVDHVAVRAAVAWLAAHDDDCWPLVGPSSDMGRAPWFRGDAADLAARFGAWAINPRAEVLGHLLAFPGSMPRQRLGRIQEALLVAIEARGAAIDMHELMSCAALLRSRGLPRRFGRALRDRLAPLMAAACAAPASEAYHLRPYMLVAGPDEADLVGLPSDVLGADLERLGTEQGAGGAWWPVWRWDAATPAWERARMAWASVLTEQALRLTMRL